MIHLEEKSEVIDKIKEVLKYILKASFCFLSFNIRKILKLINFDSFYVTISNVLFLY